VECGCLIELVDLKVIFSIGRGCWTYSIKQVECFGDIQHGC
jgi:hypothetical protein